jgi:hypothetical protein
MRATAFFAETLDNSTVNGRIVFPDTTGAYAHVKFINDTDPGEFYEFNTQPDGTFTFQTSGTDVVVGPFLGPTEFQVYQNYPNPVGDLTTIDFYTTVPGDVTVEVFNIIGQTIDKEVYSMQAGKHAVGYKPGGGAGVQFYRVTQPDGKSHVKKLVTIDSFADGGLTGEAPHVHCTRCARL